MIDFEHKIKFENYYNNEPVGIAVFYKDILPGPIDANYWKYIPQELFHRLLSIGIAYKLHFSEIIDNVVDTILNKDQIEYFEKELSFILTVINDSALQEIIKIILNETKVIDTNQVLIISPP